jgi:formylglycine-generating enzyme required for sulfatase activity
VTQKLDDLGSDFDRAANLMAELDKLKIHFDEKERGYKDEIKRLEGQINDTQGRLKVATASTQVSMVEHMAMKQELEGLRQMVKDLQGDLESTNEQSQITEDQLEDKNDKIERLSQEIDMLRGDMEEGEYKRRESEEAREQLEKRLYQLQEELEKASAKELAGTRREEPSSGGAKSLIVGGLFGVLLMLLGLEAFSVMSGKGELIALIQKPNAETEPVVTSNGGEQTTVTQQSTKPVAQPGGTQVDTTGDTATELSPKQEVRTSSTNVEVEQPIDRTTQKNEAKPSSQLKVVTDDVGGQRLISLPGGGFTMGSGSGVSQDEMPAHAVTLKPFMIGQSEVTFAQYDRFATATGRAKPDDNGWGRGDRPVINVSWQDAQAYAKWLSETTGHNYRLPTEAEWEYAAAGGTTSAYWWGYKQDKGRANCFNCGNSWDGRSTAPVVSFEPNPYGLYSTAGNASEWVQDCYKKSYNGVATDGTAFELPNCGERVARGGSFNKPAISMRTTKRSRYLETTKISSVGFRIARDI